MKTKILHLILPLAMAAVPCMADPPEESRPPSSLDEALLDELDNQLLEGLDDIPIPADRSSQSTDQGEDSTPDLPDAISELDEILLDQLGEGEDLGQEAPDPLISIARRMRTVEELISQRNTSERTQRIQNQIIADMDVLIEQMKKKCAGGQCNNDGPKQPGKASSGNKAGSGENKGSNRPAREAADRVGESAGQQPELDRLERMLKSVWGHLPTKVREQMQSGRLEEFLPKYQQLIEDYYKRLAAEQPE